VEVCYRPPNQEDREDEAFYRQIGAASGSQALILMRDFIINIHISKPVFENQAMYFPLHTSPSTMTSN